MIEIIPVSKNLNLTISVPGSKSITNRILLLSSFAYGETRIKGALLSDDTKYMIEALRVFGIEINVRNKTFIVNGKTYITGDKKIYLGNAGTATRFLTAASVLRSGKTYITGDKRMLERPIGGLVNALKGVGVKIEAKKGLPPILVDGNGRLNGGIIKMKGDISSQFISAILMVAPFASHGLVVEIDGVLISRPYVDITISSMKDFGVVIKEIRKNRFLVNPQVYKPVPEYLIEGDASSASYYYALAALTGSAITVDNVYFGSSQGDVYFTEILERMGARRAINKDRTITITGTEQLNGLGCINMEEYPDIAMTLAVLLAFTNTKTRIEGISSLRVKETDRIEALTTELKKVGVQVESFHDAMEIKGGGLKGAVINTYNDHRMAMCFAVVGGKQKDIVIKDPGCVSKTYPTFFDDFPVEYIKL